MAFVPTVNTALLSDRRPSQIPPTFSTSTSTGASLSTTGESIPVGVPSSGEASAPSSSSTTQPGPSSPPAASTSSAAPKLASPAKALDSLADSAAGSAPRRGSVLEVFSNTPQGGARRQSMLDTFAAQGEKYLNKATSAAQNLINDAQVRGSTSPQTSRSGSVSHPTSAPSLSGSGGNIFNANAPTTLRSSISELSNNISAAVDSSSSPSPATNNVGTGTGSGNTFNANAPTNLRASIGELSGNFDKAVKEEKEEGKGEGKGLLGLVQSTIENLTNTIDSRTKTADHPGLLTQLKQGSEAVLEKAEGLFNTEAAGRRASLATPAATSSTAAAAPTTAASGPGPSTQASTSGTYGATTIPSTEPIVTGPSSEIIAEASSHSSGIVPTHPGSSGTGNGKGKEESAPVIETTTNTVAHSDV